MTLPAGFVRMIDGYGFAPFSRLVDSLESSQPEVSLRLNPAKYHRSLPPLQQVAWCDTGYYLPQREAFTFDPALHQGAYYVQDASSMFIGEVARQIAGDAPVRWLDACAAPGGKTTAVAAALPAGSVVVANEYDPRRAEILRENVAKWGNPAVCVTRGDTARFTPHAGVFDIVAADVPCSGEGMMRKDAEAVEQWSESLVESCARRQREIVANLWPALRPGGFFVYSTCTFNTVENERMVQWMIDEWGAEPVEIATDPSWNIAPGINVDFPCYRFVPGVVRGEGLFMAVVRKPGDSPRRDVAAKKSKPAKLPAGVASWIAPSAQVELAAEGDSIVMRSIVPAASGMPAELQPASVIARVKGKDIIPAQTLALSTAFNPDAFPAVDVDRATALTFLRCEALRLDSDVPRGVVLLRYAGEPLGFVKNIGNRANNLYPAEWRIRSAFNAEALPPLPF